MNRDFFLPQITPAKARMMVVAAKCANLFISPEIAQIAARDRLTEADLKSFLDIDPLGLDICQFIADYQHRCVIPFDMAEDQVYRAVAAMAPKDRPILLITDDPLLWVRRLGEKVTPFGEKNTDRCQWVSVRKLDPVELTRNRDRYVIAYLTPEHVGYEWLGKLFAEMVIVCRQGDQYNLPLGGAGQTTAAKHAAAILYPQVVAALDRDRNFKLKGNPALPLIGAFNGALAPKSKKSGFRLKKFGELLDDL